VGRPRGAVTVEVVVLVPAPALRWAVSGRVGAVVVVAVVTGRVRVEVTGRVVGRVRVDVVGRVGGAVVMGAMVVMGGGGGGVAVVVVVGAVPVPATGGRLNMFRASSTLMGYDRLKSSISWFSWVRSTGWDNSVTISVMVLRSRGGVEGEPTPAGEKVGVSMRSDKSVCCPPSLRRVTLSTSRCSATSNDQADGRDIHGQGVDLR